MSDSLGQTIIELLIAAVHYGEEKQFNKQARRNQLLTRELQRARVLLESLYGDNSNAADICKQAYDILAGADRQITEDQFGDEEKLRGS